MLLSEIELKLLTRPQACAYSGPCDPFCIPPLSHHSLVAHTPRLHGLSL